MKGRLPENGTKSTSDPCWATSFAFFSYPLEQAVNCFSEVLPEPIAIKSWNNVGSQIGGCDVLMSLQGDWFAVLLISGH
jgi:hypothetical protein